MTTSESEQTIHPFEGDKMVYPSQDEWMKAVTESMILSGWLLDRDDETTLGFSFKTRDGGHWVRDYDKKTRVFVHFDATQRVSLVQVVQKVVEGEKDDK